MERNEWPVKKRRVDQEKNERYLIKKTRKQYRIYKIEQTKAGALINQGHDSVGIYMFKVNSRNIRTRCEICSKLTIKTSERRQF